MKETFDLVWLQTMGGGTEVLRRNIPADEARGVLFATALDCGRGVYGPGVVVFLRPSGEDLDSARLQPKQLCEQRLYDVWKLLGRCELAFELISTARSIVTARQTAKKLQGEIKQALDKNSEPTL